MHKSYLPLATRILLFQLYPKHTKLSVTSVLLIKAERFGIKGVKVCELSANNVGGSH